ncbi:hypothetical protein [Spirochaeta dissipatitropha]
MITSASSAAIAFLCSAISLGAAAGWGFRLFMPVQAKRSRLLDLPEPASVRRRVQSARRAWLLFSLALATATAAAGWLTESAVLGDPLALYVLSAGSVVGLLLICFPLSAGLPLLAGFFALAISLVAQSGPLSPLQPTTDPLHIRPLQLGEEETELSEMDQSRMELQLWYADQTDRLKIELDGNAYRVVWHEYRISPWYLLLRTRVLVPAKIQSSYVSHREPEAFSASGEFELNEVHDFPPWIRVEISEYYEGQVIPRLQRTVTHDYNQGQ